jgi:hypothetical protein
MVNGDDENVDNIYKDETYFNNNKNWHQEDSPYKASFVQKSIKKNKISFIHVLILVVAQGSLLKYSRKIIQSRTSRAAIFHPIPKYSGIIGLN